MCVPFTSLNTTLLVPAAFSDLAHSAVALSAPTLAAAPSPRAVSGDVSYQCDTLSPLAVTRLANDIG